VVRESDSVYVGSLSCAGSGCVGFVRCAERYVYSVVLSFFLSSPSLPPSRRHSLFLLTPSLRRPIIGIRTPMAKASFSNFNLRHGSKIGRVIYYCTIPCPHLYTRWCLLFVTVASRRNHWEERWDMAGTMVRQRERQ
jgi:hypothetical protein